MNINYENEKTKIFIDLVYDNSKSMENIFKWTVKLFFDTWNKFRPIIMSEKFIPYFGVTLFAGKDVREVYFKDDLFITESEHLKKFFDNKVSVDGNGNGGKKDIIKAMSASLGKLEEVTNFLKEDKIKTVMVLISDAWDVLKNNNDPISFVPDFSFLLLNELLKKSFFDSTKEWDMLIHEKKDCSLASGISDIKRCYWFNEHILNDAYVTFYENNFYLPLQNIIMS